MAGDRQARAIEQAATQRASGGRRRLRREPRTSAGGPSAARREDGWMDPPMATAGERDVWAKKVAAAICAGRPGDLRWSWDQTGLGDLVMEFVVGSSMSARRTYASQETENI